MEVIELTGESGQEIQILQFICTGKKLTILAEFLSFCWMPPHRKIERVDKV